MKYKVGPAFFNDALKGNIVGQISIDEKKAIILIGPIQQVLDIVQRTSPSAHAVNFPLRVFQQKIRQMRADHAGNTCHQGPFIYHLCAFLKIMDIFETAAGY
jgi:hypothetical protein